MIKIVDKFYLVVRVLSILIFTILFGWYNIFTYLNSGNLTKTSGIIWLVIGLSYVILTCLIAINITNNIVRRVVNVLYLLFSSAVTAILILDLLFSLIFGQTRLLFVDLILLMIVLGNAIMVVKKHEIHVKSRFVIWLTIMLSLFSVGLLTIKWGYLAEKIRCTGASNTKVGNREKWSYNLTRLQCWNYQLFQ